MGGLLAVRAAVWAGGECLMTEREVGVGGLECCCVNMGCGWVVGCEGEDVGRGG